MCVIFLKSWNFRSYGRVRLGTESVWTQFVSRDYVGWSSYGRYAQVKVNFKNILVKVSIY